MGRIRRSSVGPTKSRILASLWDDEGRQTPSALLSPIAGSYHNDAAAGRFDEGKTSPDVFSPANCGWASLKSFWIELKPPLC